MTAPLRGPPGPVADASAMGGVSWEGVRRSMLIAAAVGAFLSFVEAFGSGDMPFLLRTAFMVALSCAGAGLGILSFRLAMRIPWTRERWFLRGAMAGALMTVPMGLVVWSSTHLIPGAGAPLRQLPGYVGVSLVMSEAITLLVVFLNVRAVQIGPVSAPAPPPPKFLERLPLKLRGAEVWAVEAEDHYLRLHTSKGQDLILMRLADAVDELAGIEGAQVHRSWWVARDAIADARRGDGRATLTLRDGSEVPVSRTYARIIRELGWI
ncbi:MAG TPA: LytTR family DNA-binding domain-containing protein [Phenylobacterium sp.]|nr:LytTR family DNA-binding domain-containing protein [Phenylobacterium sp.]